MPEDRKDSEREDEEFEPLDTFFAPIEDVDWPEEQSRRETAEPGKRAPGPPPGPPMDGLDEELLLPDISDDPLAGKEEVAEPGPLEPASAPEPAMPPGPSEATAELSGQEWEELRLDVGGSRPDEAMAMTESGPAYPEPEADDELSLEDLKNPPPEYADLPGPPDEAPPPGISAPPVSEETPISEEVAPSGAEPELEALEAAAEHFAESLRDEPPVPQPTAPLDPETGTAPTPQEVEQDLLSDLDRKPAPPPPVPLALPPVPA